MSQPPQSVPIWRWGTAGQPPFRVRSLILLNLAALIGMVAAASYFVFFLFYDARGSAPLLLTQTVAFFCYLLVPWLNRFGLRKTALAHAAVVAYANVLVLTWFLSTAAGIHLYFLGVALIVPHLFPRLRGVWQTVFVLIPVILFVLCVVLYHPPHARMLVSERHVMDGLFVYSAIGTALLILLLGFYMQSEIARAEQEMERLTEELKALSATDALTGLANRRTLDEFLELQWRQLARTHKPMTVLMCDIDYFKPYNDSLGHQAGDEALRRVARTMREVAARPGDLVARFGGEEFVAVLGDTDTAGGVAVAEQMRAAVRDERIPHGHGPAGPYLTISIGVCTAIPDGPFAPSSLIAGADEALYAAKQAGRDRVVSCAGRIPEMVTATGTAS
jgi:diguanylate cyclase (GGDEF)-like protein